jgi:hypothetical protein
MDFDRAQIMLVNLRSKVKQVLVKVRKNHAYDTIYHPVAIQDSNSIKVHYKLQLMTKDGKQESFSYN